MHADTVCPGLGTKIGRPDLAHGGADDGHACALSHSSYGGTALRLAGRTIGPPTCPPRFGRSRVAGGCGKRAGGCGGARPPAMAGARCGLPARRWMGGCVWVCGQRRSPRALPGPSGPSTGTSAARAPPLSRRRGSAALALARPSDRSCECVAQYCGCASLWHSPRHSRQLRASLLSRRFMVDLYCN